MAVTFGINEGILAPRTSPGVYGTAVDIGYIQMLGAVLRTLSAEGTGNDRIVVVASRIIAGEMQIRLQGAPFETLEIVLGIDIVEEGSTPNETRTITIPGGHRLPHFAIVGKGLQEESLGDQLIFAPNLVVTSNITVASMEYGNLNTMEFTAMAVDDEDYGILSLIERETATTLALPPANL